MCIEYSLDGSPVLGSVYTLSNFLLPLYLASEDTAVREVNEPVFLYLMCPKEGYQL